MIYKYDINSMSKRKKKMSFLFRFLDYWLSNGILLSINELKQGLWCTIWLSYIYTEMAAKYLHNKKMCF